jgi:hypothetical protein
VIDDSRWDACSEDKSGNDIVSVTQNRLTFRIHNAPRLKVTQIKVDGCLIAAGRRCDYLFEVGEGTRTAVYVELKGGSHIEEAEGQLTATMDMVRPRHDGWHRVCYVVAGGVFGPSKQAIEERMWASHRLRPIFKCRRCDVWVEQLA